jgi:hypothetical protein
LCQFPKKIDSLNIVIQTSDIPQSDEKVEDTFFNKMVKVNNLVYILVEVQIGFNIPPLQAHVIDLFFEDTCMQVIQF